MVERVFTLNKESPFLIFNAPFRSTLWVDRIVFNTKDPRWSSRIAGTELTVLMMVDEDDDDGGQSRSFDKQEMSIGSLNRNSFVKPVFDIVGGWGFASRDSIIPSTPHTWSHSVLISGSFELQDHESIDLSIRTTARWFDYNSMIRDLKHRSSPN